MVRAWAYPFGHRHGEAAFVGERIGGRQRLFEPPAKQIFALSSSDLEPIGKLERNIRDDGIEQRRAASSPCAIRQRSSFSSRSLGSQSAQSSAWACCNRVISLAAKRRSPAEIPARQWREESRSTPSPSRKPRRRIGRPPSKGERNALR